jgi:hypothetical protein
MNIYLFAVVHARIVDISMLMYSIAVSVDLIGWFYQLYACQTT